MRTRLLIGASLVVAGVLAPGSVANGSSTVQRAFVVHLQEPIKIDGTIVMGPVLVVHDPAKDERGQPCTSVYRYETNKGATEELVTFHCIPARRAATDTCIFTTRHDQFAGYVLTEFQFPGETEGHQVPAGR
jgi:hypothetical protein